MTLVKINLEGSLTIEHLVIALLLTWQRFDLQWIVDDFVGILLLKIGVETPDRDGLEIIIYDS